MVDVQGQREGVAAHRVAEEAEGDEGEEVEVHGHRKNVCGEGGGREEKGGEGRKGGRECVE